MTSPAPYPADTRAKGWRLEIDHERIRQSDTWALATPEVRPWLLMLWMVAWEQTPCGSLPDDDALICARIGMSPKNFAKARDVLMRGWWKADDGRLYHNVLAIRVQEMLARRTKDRERTNKRRAAGHDGVTRDTHGTTSGVAQESGVSSTPEPVPDTSKEKRKRKEETRAPAAHVRPPDIPEQVWSDWLALRKAKRAPVTQTVVDGARAEAEKAGVALADFLAIWCRRGSQGLEASWLKPEEIRRSSGRAASEPAWRTEQRNRVLKAVPGIAARPESATTIDVEVRHVPPATLG